jgi:hypothetical protein
LPSFSSDLWIRGPSPMSQAAQKAASPHIRSPHRSGSTNIPHARGFGLG